MDTGKLLGIAIREQSRAPMSELTTALVTTESGCQNDFRGKPGQRQVTILSREAWDAACAEIGESLDWTTRRANLLVEGFDLKHSQGATVTIGELVLLVTGETDPCGRMVEAHPKLKDALTPVWRGGALCRVISDGQISVGDSVTFLPKEDSATGSGGR